MGGLGRPPGEPCSRGRCGTGPARLTLITLGAGFGVPRMAGTPPRGVSYRQAVEIALRLLSGQWVVAVLAALAVGPLPFGQIIDEVNTVEAELGQRTHSRPLSPKVLAQTLDRMERDRLVTRREHLSGGRRAVHYELTRTGQTLLAMLRPLAEWVQAYELGAGDDAPPTT